MPQHIPKVRIVIPEPDKLGMTPVIFGHITIDDVEWAVASYKIDGNVKGIQHVTLEFLADVTLRHPDA